MKKYILGSLFVLSLSSSFISCRETKEAANETGDAIEEGIDETQENTGLGGEDDL